MAVETRPGSFYRLNCALVIEDSPVGDDSRLDFESFPSSIEELYSLSTRAEIGANGRPQPSSAAYRGGNWSSFSLQLQFRAGDRAGADPSLPPFDYDRNRLEAELIAMERKARWCQALAFPLERKRSGTEANRTFGGLRASLAGGPGGASAVAALDAAVSILRSNDPPIVLIVFGAWMVIRGYVENVGLRWQGPYDPETVRPYGCEVTLSVKPLMITYPTWQSVRGGPWTEYTTSTAGQSLGSAEEVANEQRRRQEVQANAARQAQATGTGA